MRGKRQWGSLLAVAVSLAWLPVAARAEAIGTEAVAEAVRLAVVERLGARAEVRVTDVVVRWSAPLTSHAAAGTDAVPSIRARVEPNQRLGKPLHFLLHDGAPAASHRAIGAVQARVQVRLPVVRVARDIARGAVIGIADVAEVWDEPVGVSVKALPTMAQIVGAQATRDLRQGTLVSSLMARALPVVRPGDELIVRATVGGIEVVGKAIAHQAGRLGQVIRVANADSGRKLRARVVGPREVEVEHVR